jgi:lysophospholipase L1-like esterase
MQHRLVVIVAFLLLAVARLAQAVPQPPYYLALGDSLARGIQPLPDGALVETNQGYVDDLYAAYRLTHPFLRLKKLGCSGETTTTMITGGVCSYGAGNQLAQAVLFLQTHPVALITITIGGDNILHCISIGGINETCRDAGVAAALADLPHILIALQAVAPNVPIVAANYYDPFLAAAVLLPSPTGELLALASLVETVNFNTLLEGIYGGFGVPVADVASAFHTTDYSNVPLINLPRNVVLSLIWTWMSATPPRGPDIHPRAIGYAVIAGAFVRAIGPL